MLWSVGSVVLLTVAFVVALAWVPFNRWVFTHAGRRIEVRNYGLTEAIRVDGESVPHSRVAGDYVTFATHMVPTPGEEPLYVEISTSAFAMRCVARAAGRIVFDSLAELPPSPLVEDVRWPAAQTLLADLGTQPDTARSAATLRGVLEKGFLALERAKRLARAHHTLGGDQMDPVVLQHERRVMEALELVRELHLAASGAGSPQRASSTSPRSSTMRSAERAQVDRVSSTVVGRA